LAKVIGVDYVIRRGPDKKKRVISQEVQDRLAAEYQLIQRPRDDIYELPEKFHPKNPLPGEKFQQIPGHPR